MTDAVYLFFHQPQQRVEVNFFRIATVAILAPVFILVCLYAPLNLFAAIMGALGAICFTEYSGMAKSKGITVFRLRGLIAVLVLPIVFSFSSTSLVYILLVAILISTMVSGLGDPEKGMESTAFTLFGIIYMGLAFSSAVLTRSLPSGEMLFLLVCFATWGADTGAFYVGKAIGKTKLAPAISPNKTIEGLVGGVLFSLLFSFAAATLLFDSLDAVNAIAAGAIGGLVGPIGDLFESMMKRYFGVKDSGTILPGHGGLLDRADALMLTSPAFYLFLAVRDGLF